MRAWAPCLVLLLFSLAVWALVAFAGYELAGVLS